MVYFVLHDDLQVHSFLANDIISLFFMTKWYFIMYTYHIFFINLSIDRHLHCFYNLPIANSITINMGVQASLVYADFDSFSLKVI
jgi:hypothetical protein